MPKRTHQTNTIRPGDAFTVQADGGPYAELLYWGPTDAGALIVTWAIRGPRQDYRPEEGARFEVHLEKARGIIGDDAKPFEAKLVQDGDAMAWACRDIEDVQLETVHQLHAEKMSIRDIAEETGIPKSTVQRMVKKLGGGVL